MSNGASTGNVIAALCNVFVPGLGHLVLGRIMTAAVVFVVVTVGYYLWFLVVPLVVAALVHLWSIWNAATARAR